MGKRFLGQVGLGQAAEGGASGCLWSLCRLLGHSKAWKRRGVDVNSGPGQWAGAEALSAISERWPRLTAVQAALAGHRGHCSVYKLHNLPWQP